MALRDGTWRRSSRCESHQCVEVAFLPDRVLARDGRGADGPVLTIGERQWRAFCAAVTAGRLLAGPTGRLP